jgi:hypothetical protein
MPDTTLLDGGAPTVINGRRSVDPVANNLATHPDDERR